jgi:hypothetical protein
MKAGILIFSFCLIGMSCTNKVYYTEDAGNPVFKANTVFQSYEDFSSPKFEHLRTRYQLDTIFHGETDEFKRILLLSSLNNQA